MGTLIEADSSYSSRRSSSKSVFSAGSTKLDKLENAVIDLKRSVDRRQSEAAALEDELNMMEKTVKEFLNKDSAASELVSPMPADTEKDTLVFHGVPVDSMEVGEDPEVNKNFLEHNIKKLLKKHWGIDTTAVLTHVYRWQDGPKLRELAPIVVVFQEKRDKDQVWMKIKENAIVKEIVVTQDSSERRIGTKPTRSPDQKPSSRNRSPTKPPQKPKVAKTRQNSVSISPTKQRRPPPRASKSPTKEPPAKIRTKREVSPVKKPRKDSLVPSLGNKTSSSKESDDTSEEKEIYGNLEPGFTLLLHGLESDWIEEEMSDDDDFRKDVIEQKVKKLTQEVGLTRKIVYKNFFRWEDGPPHLDVPPVLIQFKEKKDRNEVYQALREGLKKSGLVITEDSRSRLAGNKPKEVSTKLNFASFMEHYQSYTVAQTLYNKMVRLI